LVVVFLVPLGLSGCETKDKPADTATVEPETKETAPADKPAADKPAADKPKDHPAH
jgi:hypothetical protein